LLVITLQKAHAAVKYLDYHHNIAGLTAQHNFGGIFNQKSDCWLEIYMMTSGGGGGERVPRAPITLIMLLDLLLRLVSERT